MNNTNKWTEDEIILLKEKYSSSDKKTLLKLFNRTILSITIKANRLKLIKINNNWSKDEILKLKEIYSKTPISELKKIFPQHIHSINAKARQLKLKKYKEYIWSKEESNILIENYNKKSLDEIMILLPNRSKKSISGRAFSFKLTNKSDLWSEEEVKILKEYVGKNTLVELMNFFPNRTKISISKKCNSLGLKYIPIKNNKDKWDDTELSLLISSYSKTNINDLIKILPNKGKMNIINRANKLGIYKEIKTFGWDEDEIKLLKEVYPYSKTKDIKHLFHTSTIANINAKARNLNIKKNYIKKTFVEPNKYLNIIDPNMAYILGYLWADGHLACDKRNNYRLSLECVKTDIDSIRYIFNSVGDFNYHVRNKIISKDGCNRKPQASLTSSDKLFCTFLDENDYRLKSYVSPTKILSKIPSKLIPYFITGLSDGDGCFHIGKSCIQYAIGCTIDYDWSSIENILKELKLTYNIRRETNKKGHKRSIIKICNRKHVLIFAEYMYKNYEVDNIGLRRKYNKYLEIKKRCEN